MCAEEVTSLSSSYDRPSTKHVAATMSIFAFYFTANLLREAGWPRKLGRFKGEGYDTEIADAAVAQSIDWGATLGAGRPRLALQMIAEMFRDRDWDGDDAPDVKAFVEADTSGPWATGASPQEAVPPLELAKHWGKSITLEQFRDQRAVPMEQPLLGALLWGLRTQSASRPGMGQAGAVRVDAAHVPQRWLEVDDTATVVAVVRGLRTDRPRLRA